MNLLPLLPSASDAPQQHPAESASGSLHRRFARLLEAALSLFFTPEIEKGQPSSFASHQAPGSPSPPTPSASMPEEASLSSVLPSREASASDQDPADALPASAAAWALPVALTGPQIVLEANTSAPSPPPADVQQSKPAATAGLSIPEADATAAPATMQPAHPMLSNSASAPEMTPDMAAQTEDAAPVLSSNPDAAHPLSIESAPTSRRPSIPQQPHGTSPEIAESLASTPERSASPSTPSASPMSDRTAAYSLPQSSEPAPPLPASSNLAQPSTLSDPPATLPIEAESTTPQTRPAPLSSLPAQPEHTSRQPILNEQPAASTTSALQPSSPPSVAPSAAPLKVQHPGNRSANAAPSPLAATIRFHVRSLHRPTPPSQELPEHPQDPTETQRAAPTDAQRLRPPASQTMQPFDIKPEQTSQSATSQAASPASPPSRSSTDHAIRNVSLAKSTEASAQPSLLGVDQNPSERIPIAGHEKADADIDAAVELADFLSAPDETGRPLTSPFPDAPARPEALPRAIRTATWFQIALNYAERIRQHFDGQMLEVELADGEGVLRVETRRHPDHVAVSVQLSDPQLRALVAAHADRIQEALQAHYQTAVQFSLADGGEQRGQQQAFAHRSAHGTPLAPGSDASASAPVESPHSRGLHPGSQHEWIG